MATCQPAPRGQGSGPGNEMRPGEQAEAPVTRLATEASWPVGRWWPLRLVKMAISSSEGEA